MTTETQAKPRSALRRYPALVWLVGAGLLALLLPSGLTLPQSGPSTLAEYAPVPGASEGRADLGELASSQSGGVGSGRGGAGQGGAADDLAQQERRSGGKLIRRAGTKRCVGSPPRQTEDPLSPPCVAFFDGDNGGATAKGVTADEVVVTVKMSNVASNNNRTDEVDCSEPYSGEEQLIDAVCKAYFKFFNDRYQTYGRTVRLISTGSNSSAVIERHRPFANVDLTPSSTFARSGAASFGFSGSPRAIYVENAPRYLSFRADTEDETAFIASYICDRLAGRPARYAGDVTIRSQTRTFGIVYASATDARPPRLKEALKRRCNLDIKAETGDNPNTTASMVKLKSAGVTTVITIVGNTAHATASNNATQIGYFPEWFVYPASDLNGIDINFHARVANQAQWANAFGVTLDYRRGALAEQPWYRAYREGCPSCPEPTLAEGAGTTFFVASIYDAMAMLFYGVQAAGPRLTAENIDKGLHAIPPQASDDPFRPAAYFGPGNYSFLKDAMAIWWDPSGRAPGSPATGCYRLPQEGRRFRAGEWPAGDDLVKAPGPCQGDTFVG